MAGLSKLELAVETGKWEGGLKKAQQALANFQNSQGGMQQALAKNSDKMAEFIRIMGNTKSTAATASQQMKEYRSSIERLQLISANLNGEQKKLADESIQKLIARYREAKQQAENFGHALEGVNSKAGGMNIAGLNITGLGDAKGMLTELGSSLGMNTQLLGALSTGSIAAAGAIAGVAAGAAAAAKAFYDYNTELAQQNQIVEVTTGLMGENADAMRDQMRAVSKVYGVDFREGINAANTLMTQFGISGEEATKLIRKGMQGMIKGDGPKLLQMIKQYAPAYRDAGIEASQLVAIINNTEGGIFTDQNMAAITMGIKNIRMMKDTTKEAMQSIGIDADTMARKLNDGTMSVFDALKQVSDKIDEVGPGSQAAGEIMNDIFGRQGVAAGTKLGKAIAQLNLNLDETSRQTGGVGDKLAELTEKTAIFEREMNKAFGVKNFEEFKIAIESDVLDALNGVLVTFNRIKDAIKSTGTNFSTAISGMTTTLELLNPKLKILHDIASYFHDIGEEARYAGDQIANIPDIPTAKDGTPLQGPAGLLAAANSGKTVKPQRTEVKHNPTTYTPTTTKTTSSNTTAKPEKVNTVVSKSMTELEQLQDQLKLVKNSMAPFGKTSEEWQTMNTYAQELQGRIDELNGVLPEVKTQFTNALSPLQLLEDEIKMVTASMENAATPEDWAEMNEYLQGLKQRLAGFKGELDTNKPKVIGEKFSNGLGMANQALGGVKSITDGLKNLGVEFGEGFEKFMGKLDGVMQVLNGINTIIGVINSARDTAYQSTMVTLMTTLTARSMIPFFANGGFTHAANGVITGSHFSGDIQPLMVNAGEGVINQADQAALFRAIKDGNFGGGGSIQSVGVRGTDLLLCLNNELRSQGKPTL